MGNYTFYRREVWRSELRHGLAPLIIACFVQGEPEVTVGRVFAGSVKARP